MLFLENCNKFITCHLKLLFPLNFKNDECLSVKIVFRLTSKPTRFSIQCSGIFLNYLLKSKEKKKKLEVLCNYQKIILKIYQKLFAKNWLFRFTNRISVNYQPIINIGCTNDKNQSYCTNFSDWTLNCAIILLINTNCR